MRQASRRCSCRCRMNANYSSDVARFGSFFGMTGVVHFSNSGVLPLIRQGRRRHRRHRDGSWMSVTAAVPQVAAAATMATEFLEVFRKKHTEFQSCYSDSVTCLSALRVLCSFSRLGSIKKPKRKKISHPVDMSHWLVGQC